MSLKLGLFAVLLFVGYEPPTEAHDIYSHLKDSGERVAAMTGIVALRPYRVTPTGVQMFVEGEWIAVPDDTIQYRALPGDTGETDGGHWCGRIQNGRATAMDYATYCAVLPPNPTAVSRPAFALREGHTGPVP